MNTAVGLRLLELLVHMDEMILFQKYASVFLLVCLLWCSFCPFLLQINNRLLCFDSFYSNIVQKHMYLSKDLF